MNHMITCHCTERYEARIMELEGFIYELEVENLELRSEIKAQDSRISKLTKEAFPNKVF